MHRQVLVILSSALIGQAGAGSAQSPSVSDTTRVRQAFDVEVPHPPTVATVGGARQLVGEVHLTSFARVPLRLSAITIEDDASGRELHRIEGDVLAGAIGGPGIDGASGDRRVVATGRRAIIYLQVALDQAPPRRVRNRIEFDIQTDTGPVPAAVVGAGVDLAAEATPVLGPPLSGGPWVAVYDPALENGHRRYVYAIGGRARIPGRFAIDWMKPVGKGVSSADQVAAGGAGAAVLAVADAVVVGLRDGIAEVVPGRPRPPLTLADATGNYVALDLGGDRYAFYEHLAPGLSVKLGSRVRRGQVIARIGSTGQASRPHLHFHVADANSPLGAEGEPYRLAGARTVGAYPSITAFEAGGPWKPIVDRTIEPALPLPNSVVMFDPADNP